ncbi:MAG: hypothetical protein ABI648_11500 [Betaproteobacteria bacterium]
MKTISMKTIALPAMLACLLAAPLAHAADEEDHAAHHAGADDGQASPEDKMAGMKMEKNAGKNGKNA